MTDYEDDEEEEFVFEEPNDFIFSNEHRESVTYVV